MAEIDSIVAEFLVESHENLDQLDRDFIVLEKDPQNGDRLSSIFRTIHTIKGTCGFFGFNNLESLSHAGENLLSRLRDGVLVLSPAMVTALLAMVDAIREMLGVVEQQGTDGTGDYRQLVAELTTLQETSPSMPPEPQDARMIPKDSEKPVSIQPVVQTPTPVITAVREPAVENLATQLQEEHPSRKSQTETSAHSSVSENSIRVDVGLLDRLMNLVGELVLARNQILQCNSSKQDPIFVKASQRLNLITTELQEGVMKTRMQPIGNIWDRFPRVVRDLATMCRKQVRIEMEGKDTELDKTIIEAIKDPLTHIIRNSVDHGIETPDARMAAGKPVEGCIRLRAFHEGGQVNIEISDDGKGINPVKIKAIALERGLITSEQAAHMSERECTHLLFLPGFSTAEKVTNVSGRGVGMDVVKTNIEKIGGAIDIQSEVGKGTIMKIRIPLTLAIIPALIVTSGNDRYAIPQVSLLELVRLDGEDARRGIERIHGCPVYRLRGNLLPLVYLHNELRVESSHDCRDADAVNIVVLQADDRQFGLVVEGINDTEEIVVKPLGKMLKSIALFAGATIMGDGRVALILDVMGIAQKSGVISQGNDRARTEVDSRAVDRTAQKQTFLLLGMGAHRRLAVPLSLVARLEEIDSGAIEFSDTQEVVQYRGQILPLVRLNDFLAGGGDRCSGLMNVVVYSENGRSVGLVVDRIIDIVEDSVDVRQVVQRNGIIGTSIIQQQVTDLLDVGALIRSGVPSFVEHSSIV